MDIKDQLAIADGTIDKLRGDVDRLNDNVVRLEDLVVKAQRLILQHHNASKRIELGRWCPHCTHGNHGEETPEYKAIADEAARIRQRNGT